MKKWPVIALTAIVLFGCKKPANPPQTHTTSVQVDTPDIAKGLAMVVNGIQWTATQYTVERLPNALTITCVNDDNHYFRIVKSQLPGIGSYDLPDPGSPTWPLFAFQTDTSQYKTRFLGESGNLTITKLSDTDIQGAFLVFLRNATTHETLSIKTGVFNLKRK